MITEVDTTNDVKDYDDSNKAKFDDSNKAKFDDSNNVNYSDHGKVHDDEKNLEKDDDSTINLMVNSVVSTTDNPSLPCLTFRFWVLSTFFTSLGAALSVFYYFRPNSLTYSLLFVILASYIFGKFMERVLPTKTIRIKNWEFSLNPSPFNYKEHACITAASTAGGTLAYAVDIIAIQELFYNTRVGFITGFLLLISTQMIGYGLAGFVRKYLVHPSNMIWPQSLVYVAMYNSLHGNIAETNKKIRFFYIAFASMFIWQFIPSYLFLWLSSIAVLCLAFPSNDIAKLLGSGTRGLGIMNFSLDWNAIGLVSPLITPWWSQVNFYVGLIFSMWIIAPIAYYNNLFDGKKFPIMSLHSFDKDGNTYNQTSVIDQSTGALNITAYANYSPVYLSVTFAICYGYYFAQFPATIVHVALFHGKEIWARYKKTRKEELNDIHCRLMSVYPEVPYLWYGIIFTSMLIIAIILGYTSGAHLPWWALLLAVAIAAIMVIPIGIIQAISNWAIGLNVITEFVCGYLLPGYPLANVYFKTYGYISMAQCLLFIQDLKTGHYMKVPPRSMFIAQIWGTIVGTIVNFWSMQFIIDAKRHYLDGTEEDPTGQWVGYQSEIFNTASILWGLIGPAKTFGEESLYNILLWGFLIGFFLPIPFYLLHQKYPKAGFNLVNVPVILYGSSLLPGYNTNFIISGFIVSFIFQFYVFHYKKGWWTRYNYVMAGAFDSAAQIVTMFILICLGTVTAPIWWGTDPASQGEHCYSS